MQFSLIVCRDLRLLSLARSSYKDGPCVASGREITSRSGVERRGWGTREVQVHSVSTIVVLGLGKLAMVITFYKCILFKKSPVHLIMIIGY